MSTDQPIQKLSNLDKFSIVTGIIGLLADCISLGGVFVISKRSQTASFHIWILVLLTIIYSIALINFYSRSYFHKRSLLEYQEAKTRKYRRIERGTQSITILIGFPLLICYFTLAFFVNNDLFFDEFFAYPYMHSIRLPITRGLLYGTIVAAIVCTFSHEIARNIYKAFDHSYGP